MAEVPTSSQSERPCAAIEETRKPPGDAGGSSSPVNGDDHTGKRLAGKPHEPFERADGGRAKARPPPTLQRRSRRTTTGDRPRSWWSEGRGPRGTRARTARAGLRTGQACQRGWTAYGTLHDRERRNGSPRSSTMSPPTGSSMTGEGCRFEPSFGEMSRGGADTKEPASVALGGLAQAVSSRFWPTAGMGDQA